MKRDRRDVTPRHEERVEAWHDRAGVYPAPPRVLSLDRPASIAPWTRGAIGAIAPWTSGQVGASAPWMRGTVGVAPRSQAPPHLQGSAVCIYTSSNTQL